MNQNYLQLIIVLLIVGSSFITWVIRKLQEQRIKKAQRDAIERRRLELLRTGRDPGEQSLEAPMGPGEPAATPSDPEAARRAELARRRREQIEMLRRRQAGQAGGRGGQAGGGQGGGAVGNASASGGQASEITIQLPGGRVLRIPAPQQPGQTGPAPAGGSAGERRPATPRPAPKTAPTRSSPALERPKSRAKPAPVPRPADPSDTGESSTHRLVETRGAAAAGPAVTAASIDGKPMTAADWRRAFIAGQILGRPVAERRPGEEPLAPM